MMFVVLGLTLFHLLTGCFLVVMNQQAHDVDFDLGESTQDGQGRG